MQARIAELARQRATAVSLRDLYKFGHKPNPSVRLQNAIFLHHELPIRMAQRIEELRNLPFGLHESKPILQVIDWYSSFVDTLTTMPRLSNSDDERRFTETIEAQLQTPSLVVVMLSSAVSQSGAGLDEPLRCRPGATRSQQLSYMQSVLDRFFTARIGLRFLMEHHIISGRQQPDGWAGVIQANFDPTRVLQEAADDARHLCDTEFGTAPDIHIGMADVEDNPSATRNNRLTYVPSHMHYICTELLKNAMRATTERHRDAEALPPISVTASFGEDHLGIRISDEGGGIPLSQVGSMARRWDPSLIGGIHSTQVGSVTHASDPPSHRWVVSGAMRTQRRPRHCLSWHRTNRPRRTGAPRSRVLGWGCLCPDSTPSTLVAAWTSALWKVTAQTATCTSPGWVLRARRYQPW